MKRRHSVILLFTKATALVALGCAVLYLLIRLFGPPDETRDAGDYAHRLNRWSASGLVGHFPKAIPADAQLVRFVEFPGFLQGGGYIQLRLRLPAEQVQAIHNSVRGATTRAYVGGGFFDHYNNDQDSNWPTTEFRTADSPPLTHAFPDHYTLYVLSAKDLGGAWNHGQTSGVAVSETANEVVYWADRW
jgi:hypothetical protein